MGIIQYCMCVYYGSVLQVELVLEIEEILPAKFRHRWRTGHLTVYCDRKPTPITRFLHWGTRGNFYTSASPVALEELFRRKVQRQDKSQSTRLSAKVVEPPGREPHNMEVSPIALYSSNRHPLHVLHPFQERMADMEDLLHRIAEKLSVPVHKRNVWK